VIFAANNADIMRITRGILCICVLNNANIICIICNTSNAKHAALSALLHYTILYIVSV
jgi:hypothetical protein